MQMMSCLVMPLSSSVVCQEERSSVARAGSAARLQQSSDWPTGPPFQTRVTSPPGNSLCLMPLRNRGTVVEDITAAMLSSPNPWPCHSRQARWRRVAKMFVNFCGYMILYVFVYVCVYMCERARAWRGCQHDAVASYESVQIKRISTASKLFYSG